MKFGNDVTISHDNVDINLSNVDVHALLNFEEIAKQGMGTHCDIFISTEENGKKLFLLIENKTFKDETSIQNFFTGKGKESLMNKIVSSQKFLKNKLNPIVMNSMMIEYNFLLYVNEDAFSILSGSLFRTKLKTEFARFGKKSKGELKSIRVHKGGSEIFPTKDCIKVF
jgi:hypothetical protein